MFVPNKASRVKISGSPDSFEDHFMVKLLLNLAVAEAHFMQLGLLFNRLV
jgi:hypothetical protein